MTKTISSPNRPKRRRNQNLRERTLPPVTSRGRDGRFAAGNPGGPGRPKKSEETNRQFLSTVQRIINQPDRFTDRQREALVDLVTSLMDGPDHQAITAATVLVQMDQADLEAGS